MLAGDLDREAASGNTSTPAHVQAGERERERERERDVGAVSSASRGSSLRSSTPRPPPAGSRTLPVHDFPDHPRTQPGRADVGPQRPCKHTAPVDPPRARSTCPGSARSRRAGARAKPTSTVALCVPNPREHVCARQPAGETPARRRSTQPVLAGFVRGCTRFAHPVCKPSARVEAASVGVAHPMSTARRVSGALGLATSTRGHAEVAAAGAECISCRRARCLAPGHGVKRHRHQQVELGGA